MLRTILLLSYFSAAAFIVLCISGICRALGLHYIDHSLHAILYMFLFIIAESVVLFYFIGTGKYIKDIVNERRLSQEYIIKTRLFKKELFPKLITNILLFIIVFTAGGSINAFRLPVFVHAICALFLGYIFLRSISKRRILLIENARLLLTVYKEQ